jgi:hypothetical protein
VGEDGKDIGMVMMSVAPTDPVEKEAWAQQMLRVQVAMWLPASCAQCHVPYRDVDDFLERNPKAGPGFPGEKDAFVDSDCWSDEWDNRIAQMREEDSSGE